MLMLTTPNIREVLSQLNCITFINITTLFHIRPSTVACEILVNILRVFSQPNLESSPNHNKMASMDIMTYMPKAAITAFAAIGFVYISTKVLTYVVLLLELFVLSGTNVGP